VKFRVYRQGDVVVIPLELYREFVPQFYEQVHHVRTERLSVVIRGEKHNHVLEGDYEASRIGDDMFFVVVKSEALLRHPEHGEVRIGRGMYIVTRLLDAIRRDDHIAEVSEGRRTNLVSASTLRRGSLLYRAGD